jgi:hypothetical protein
MVKPNFEEKARIDGPHVIVEGKSGDPDDIASIRVILSQAKNIGGGPGTFLDEDDERFRGRAGVAGIDKLWQANVPLGNFKVGPAVAFGTEQRKENFLTITWAEPIEIVN